ncbi:hypothetical protein JNUCC1_00545 [Lentibacillus sp. JNUCC-1]|uniref:hemerythrin domain-containing protein n=1 Tax=Lentibacillus sp. JNUCC-1 TaxID=2654513 RepID=UPI0012E879AF|nr:hemerythrin domain-containing protein [Lentibacillus sp. JNUCC-1]MUV36741.1 hypothetical protein [Lentibacillus sp. JNUCC-1]
MAKKRGIKRHDSLQPLSRHHMIGLHVALKLKRAGTEQSRLTNEEIIQDLKAFWEPDGQNHFREEEEILLPAYAAYTDINQPEIVNMLLEHVIIRSKIKQVLEIEKFDITAMQTLGELLEKHIRTEERVIFPMIEQALPEDKLIELAPFLH